MSDPEDDREILDEIKALEDILAKDEQSNDFKELPISNLSYRRPSGIPSRGFGEVTPYREAEISNNDNPRDAYETNIKLIELLRESKRELLSILEKCVENKAIVEEKLRIAAKNTKSAKIFIAAAGMPYFKDAKHFPAPRNKDLIAKIQNDELRVVELRYACPWTAKDRNILWRAIRREAAAAVLNNERIEDEPSSSTNELLRQTKAFDLPKNFKAMIGPLGAREFDWLKIAATDFDNKHTPDECRVMWRVFLHPDINRYRWTKKEDDEINRLSEIYQKQDWESLAEELGTQRSGYQCFIRYNTNNRTACFDDQPWSEKEDGRLQECINKFKIGHYVPWGTVARYMKGRSKNQVYFRWRYNAAPHLKKGRFTREEDSTLLEAVKEYGKNFCKISELAMPNRSSAQLSDHYRTLVQKERGVKNLWTVGDDAMLLKLYAKYGTDWSKIAQELHGKTRTQVRHRHKSILRYWDKGISLYDIPREYDRSGTNEDREVIELLEQRRIQERNEKNRSDTIDSELVKFFQLAPPATRPGRKQKFYNEDELEDTTRNLYILLETLSVDITIPDELENRGLTEKDKQLLKSFKDYQQSRIEYAKSSTMAVECARMKMYGSTTSAGEKHFAPLCSGNCNLKENSRWQDQIDYRHRQNLDHCRVTLEMDFHTPTNISSVIGEEEDARFDKIMRIFGDNAESRPGRVVRKVYVLPPRESSAILSTVSKVVPSKNSQSCESIEQTGKTKKRKGRRANSWNFSISDGIIHENEHSGSFVEPNYHTLLGLQHIISQEKIVSNETISGSDLPTTARGRKSLEIFKKRLAQLFKYPVGLSHILRPEISVGNFQSNTLLDKDTNDGETDFPNVSSPPPKRRRLTNNRGKPSEKSTRRRKYEME